MVQVVDIFVVVFVVLTRGAQKGMAQFEVPRFDANGCLRAIELEALVPHTPKRERPIRRALNTGSTYKKPKLVVRVTVRRLDSIAVTRLYLYSIARLYTMSSTP